MHETVMYTNVREVLQSLSDIANSLAQALSARCRQKQIENAISAGAEAEAVLADLHFAGPCSLNLGILKGVPLGFYCKLQSF